MQDHDLDPETAGPAGARPHDDHEALSGQAIGHGVQAGRPDALGPGGLLQLQQAAGNAGVAGLVAQRRADDQHEGGEDASPVHEVIASRGSPLDPATRGVMESTVGADFGDVQVHTDAKAAESARSVQAHAYTVGNHIVFGEGRYRPETTEGRHTLAHELTHVVQQRQGPVDGTPAEGGIKVSHPSDRFEQEAESVARRVSSGDAAGGNDGSGAGHTTAEVQRTEDVTDPRDAVVQRQEAEDEQEEAPPEAAEAAAAGPESAEAPAAEAPVAEAPVAETPATEAPVAEAAAPEGGAGPVEEEQEEAPVSKLDQGIALQRQEADNEDEADAGA